MKLLKARLKGLLKAGRTFYSKTFCSFTAMDLARAIGAIGITSGDVVLVHSSFDAFEGFSGKPSDVLREIQEAVSTNGLLMMPTLPFTGTAIRYVERGAVFDVRRTPSRMGLLTELFRRSEGVVRSVHPTHPVAIWGKRAQEMAAGHSEAKTPCGAGSPFEKLLRERGKILLLGTDLDVLTFYHTAEELLEAKLPCSPFTSQTYRLRSKDIDGNTVYTDTRLYEPAVSRRRNLSKLAPFLKQRNAWRETRVGRMSVVALAAADIMSTVESMADRGIYCYD